MQNSTCLPGLNWVPVFASHPACEKFRSTNLSLKIMQVNMGKACNLSCRHCHLEAGPGKGEFMNREVMTTCILAFQKHGFKILDVTGGSPEMNPDFLWFMKMAFDSGIHTIVRTNLVILNEEPYRQLADYYASAKVEITASLPCYTEENVDTQRGKGVFASSIAALRRLNSLGYGKIASLPLNLVYNPGGDSLPPDQKELELEYRENLLESHGIVFNRLYALTNNPIGRFGEFLQKSGGMDGYMARLVAAFNPSAVENMMCRSQVSVDWDGKLHDCDFNLALGLQTNGLGDIGQLAAADNPVREIVFGNHCYACTAGAGSSCGGTTS